MPPNSLVIARGVGTVKNEEVNGAPREIRTPDLTVRSRSLYPAELWAHRNSLSEGVNARPALGTSRRIAQSPLTNA
jgi:hypothetical protein